MYTFHRTDITVLYCFSGSGTLCDVAVLQNATRRCHPFHSFIHSLSNLAVLEPISSTYRTKTGNTPWPGLAQDTLTHTGVVCLNMHAFGQWGKSGAARENPHRQEESMQTTHRKDLGTLGRETNRNVFIYIRHLTPSELASVMLF